MLVIPSVLTHILTEVLKFVSAYTVLPNLIAFLPWDQP